MVSIIIPCYNHEKYIESCLESLCEQTYKDIELIVCDDCSEDNSFELIKKWEPKLKERFSNVILERNTMNLGICKTLNKMIAQSKGEYIKDLASDDMLLPNAIADLLDAVDDSDIYFSNVAVMPEETKYNNYDLKSYNLVYKTRPIDGYNLTGILCGQNYISAAGVMIPRKTFENYGLYDESYCLEDFEYWLRVSVEGKFKYIDSVTTLYRDNNNSLSRFDMSEEAIARHQKFYKDKIIIFSKYEKYANEEQIRQFYNSELDSAIGTNDVDAVKSLKVIMKNKKIKITWYNRVRIPLVLMKVYPFFKLIKNIKR